MPHIEWRGGTCRVKWWTGEHHPNGRRRYESKGGFTDETEALNHGLDKESDIRNLRHVSRQSGKITVKQWCELWLKGIDVDSTSYYSYRKLMRAQINPQWGDTLINEITTVAYRVWMKQLKAKYSDNYVKSIRMLFNMLMDDAVSHRPPLIGASPVPQESRRRGRYVRPATEEKETVLTSDLHQLADNAQVVWGFTGYVFMLTTAYTGMRLGEMFGLRREFTYPNWPASDPDAERRKKALRRYEGEGMAALRVQWQHKYVRDPLRPEEKGVPTLALPKYGSVRTLVIPPFLAELHRQLLESHDSEWVFPGMTGGSLLTTDFHTTYWKPVRDGADAREGRFARPKIPPVEVFAGKRIHLVRHAHSPHLEEGGVPAVAIEARLGHIIQGVRGVYSDVTPEMERQVVSVLQARWEAERGEAGGDDRQPASQLPPSGGSRQGEVPGQE
ncbi:integrase [Streptomyces nigrescens]|uniref:Integrase n=1 Tax=Streptomyces nigrescens TaxID=1920 RepID=A0A640TAW6_STRNI|nr:integrase [Streptomyces libani]WAT94994.1 integrase [Streptomyces libani subsp. libani]GFE20152.1 hypothetical protein Sliba_06050 [Streptomyces libani subsp. libani]GGV85988.1 hypothetical protein GCM10010500_03490 [Streptomyces libani subsp. libani]